MIDLKEITAVIEAKSPLHFGRGRFGVIKRTHECIPGSIIRGAIGTALISLYCKNETVDHDQCEEELRKECPYYLLFQDRSCENSKIHFKFSYPLSIEDGGKTKLRPTPFDFKYCEGCKNYYRERENKCKRCGSNLTFLKFSPFDLSFSTSIPIQKYEIGRTAIDREGGGHAEVEYGEERAGTLHVMEVIPRGNLFWLSIFFSGGDSERPLLNSIKFVEDEGIGGGKNRGFGKISFSEVKIREIRENDVLKRAEEIANKIKSDKLRIDLTSPAIIKLGDKTLSRITPDYLTEYAKNSYSKIFEEKIELDAPKLLDLYARVETVTGWSLEDSNLIEGRRKDVYTAISPGSFFNYEVKGVENWAKALACLEILGIGEWRSHGYGSIVFSENPGNNEKKIAPPEKRKGLQRFRKLKEVPISSFGVSLRFEKPIKRDIDSLRGVIRGFTGKHERELKWLYENPRKGTKYYRFVEHELVAAKILEFKIRFLHPKFVRFRDFILKGLDYFGKEGILNGDEKVKFNVMVGKEGKEGYKPLKLDKGDCIELKFKTPVLYDVDPWSILRGIGSKIYQLYKVELPEMEEIKEKVKEWKFEHNLSKYVFRRKGNEYWGWRGGIKFEMNNLSGGEKELIEWLLGAGRITGIGKFTTIGFGDYEAQVLSEE